MYREYGNIILMDTRDYKTVEDDLSRDRTWGLLEQELDVPTKGRILAICMVKRDGRKHYGYEFLDANLSSILKYGRHINFKLYADRWNVKLEHVDVKNEDYIMFREVKDDDTIHNLVRKIFKGIHKSEDITRYTNSLRPYLDKIYKD